MDPDGAEADLTEGRLGCPGWSFPTGRVTIVKFLDGAEHVDRYVGLTPLWDGTNTAGLAFLNRTGEQLGCGAGLRPWGDARPRRVRDQDSTQMVLRPRRARCPGCGGLRCSPAQDGVAPPGPHPRGDRVGASASANGIGYRRIAAELACPPATVRRWIAAVRGAHTEWLRTHHNPLTGPSSDRRA
ncbi:hypothetical protein [Pseudonocardia alni]|uniref:hypothetical protein n=1 Tax=Pseudonocardia alni TaxID=33907 RepID=UPI00386E8B3D